MTRAKSSVEFILEQASLGSIRLAKARADELLRYAWDYFNHVAYQRSRIHAELVRSLVESASPEFQFKNWHRAVRFKYALKPLSTRGSRMFPGGRFNVGAINEHVFPTTSALYAGVDRQTAELELLGQAPQGSDLSPEELALANPASITVVAISGKVGFFLDLRTTRSLAAFIARTRTFTISRDLIARAARLGVQKPTIIRTARGLSTSLLDPDWRRTPTFTDIPANCQIFGQLVQVAKVEAILYPSKQNGRDCLAIFPEHFVGDSFVELEGDLPPEVTLRRIDAKNALGAHRH